MSTNRQKVPWSEFFRKVAYDLDIDSESLQKFKCGIEQDVKQYMEKNYPTAIHDVGGECFVDAGLLKDIRIFNKKYLRKTEADYSSQDIANNLLKCMGIPPADTMSQESLEKAVLRTITNYDYKHNVYIRRGRGGHNFRCVNFDTAQRIAADPDICSLINKQIKKAEKANQDSDSVAWKQFVLEKQHIESVVERVETEDFHTSGLSRNDRMYLMVKALFSLFFTDFDFDAYERDIIDCEALESAKDFGEEFQALNRVLCAPNFDWKYYRVKDDSPLIDAVAENIIKRIVEKDEEG